MAQEKLSIKKAILLGVLSAPLLSACGSGDSEGGGPLLGNPGNGAASSADAVESSSSEVASSSSSAAPDTPDFVDADGNGVFVTFETDMQELGALDTATLSVNFTDEDDAPVAVKGTYSVTSSCTQNSRSEVTEGISTGVGNLTFEYTPSGCAGDDVVRLSGEWSEGVEYSGSVSLSIDKETAGRVSFIEATPTKIDIIGTGGSEAAELVFEVRSQSGNPLADELVTFSFTNNAGGATLVTPDGTTDANGRVTAKVTSGTAPGTFIVTATHAATAYKATSDSVAVGTGLPVSNRFSLTATKYNPNAFNYAGGEKVTLTARAADSAGNFVADGTPIGFRVYETGQMQDSCTTVDGECSVEWSPNADGGKPDNGRVQIVAEITVKEAFNDVNQNYLFDDGDILTEDLPETYIDLDENGMFDPINDEFLDANGNGVRDMGDGKWTGPNCAHSDTSLCSDSQDAPQSSAQFGRVVTLYMAQDSNPEFCKGDGPGEDFDSSLKQVVSKGRLVLSGLAISDGNVNAINTGEDLGDCDTGNPLPGETEITFSVDVGELKGQTSWTVDSTYYSVAETLYGVTYAAPEVEEPTYAYLTLEIKFPPAFEGAAQKTFTELWTIVVNPPVAP